jgi:hypothetical protein
MPRLRRIGKAQAHAAAQQTYTMLFGERDPKLRELGQTRAGWARGSRALRLEYDDVPERIVEIAAPAAAPQDVVAMVDRKKE